MKNAKKNYNICDEKILMVILFRDTFMPGPWTIEFTTSTAKPIQILTTQKEAFSSPTSDGWF